MVEEIIVVGVFRLKANARALGVTNAVPETLGAFKVVVRFKAPGSNVA